MFIGRKGTVESDKKIDVYAYAITMYEVLSRLKAWDGCNIDMIKELVIQGHRPKIPDVIFRMAAQPDGQIIALLLDITNLSWSPDPSDRPEFKEIYNRILQFVTTSMS